MTNNKHIIRGFMVAIVVILVITCAPKQEIHAAATWELQQDEYTTTVGSSVSIWLKTNVTSCYYDIYKIGDDEEKTFVRSGTFTLSVSSEYQRCIIRGFYEIGKYQVRFRTGNNTSWIDCPVIVTPPTEFLFLDGDEASVYIGESLDLMTSTNAHVR